MKTKRSKSKRAQEDRYVPTRNYGRVAAGPILYFLTFKEIVDTFAELERRFLEENARYLKEIAEAGANLQKPFENRRAHARANYFLKVCREINRRG